MHKYLNRYILLICITFFQVAGLAYADAEWFEGDDIACTGCTAAPLPVQIIVDQHLSPVTGASAFITLLRGYQALDDNLLPSTQGQCDIAMIGGRFLKFIFEGALFSTATVAQHEYFGHGWRLREFHIHANYRIRPYDGFTSFSAAPFNNLSPLQRNSVNVGGIEATTILAKQLRNSFLESCWIDERAGHMYLLNNFDQTFYVLSTKHENNTTSGNDITAYISTLNNWHGQQVLTHNQLKKKIYLDFLDPYFFYSLYGIGTYLINGDPAFEYPMLCIGDYKYLPGLRMALAPYGPEYQLINYIKTAEHIIQATFRYGNTGGKHSSGLTLEATRLFTSELLNFDGRLDLWQQPKLFTATAAQASSKAGAAMSLIARYQVAQCFDIFAQLGYKTTGYMQGESLKHSPIARIGFLARI